MTDHSSAIFEIQFLPPISYFRVLLDFDVLYVEAHENYQKRSYRNRCEIAGPHGKQTLSVPLVKGKNQKTPIRRVKISYDQPWQKEMWHALEAAYRKSPYFVFYEEGLKETLFHPYENLLDLDKALLEKIVQWLQMRVTVRETTAFRTAKDGGLVMSDMIRPAENQLFSPGDFPAYTQVFSEQNGFFPDLSIMDLLFNKGPESILYLQEVNKPQIDNG